MLLVLFVAHAVVGAACWLVPAARSRAAFVLGAVPMAATLGYVATRWSDVVHGDVVTDRFEWVPGLDVVADARLDGFSLLMVLLVAGMGVLVMAYSTTYFSPGPASRRTAGLLVLFAGSMLGVVLADNLAWLYVCWELTSITSFLLIGADLASPAKRTAALQALLVTGAGGLAMLGGLILLAHEAGSWSLAEILADPPRGGTVPAALVLLLAGILTKSAQYPFHFWLPGAMVAPTPISAYLHSATMVKAGIYLAARLAPAFATVGWWRPIVLVLGITTMVLGALRALRQYDLKLLLAFGTVSQLGFLLVLAGAGRSAATQAATVLLLAHALFKGALFLVVGIVDHETGTRDIRHLEPLGPGWGAVKAVAVVSALSMAGVPPVAGFVAKEGAYEAFVHGGVTERLVLAGLVTGSILTFAYSARFVHGLLRPANYVTDAPREQKAEPGVPSAWFQAPALLLGLGTIAAGLVVGPLLDPLVDSAANALDPRIGTVHLALWHGVNEALLLSGLTVGLGLALFAARRPVARIQSRFAPTFTGAEGFAAVIHGLNVTARRTTGLVQSGSLPIYIGVVLVTVIVGPNIGALATGSWPELPRAADAEMQYLLAGMLIVAALSIAILRRRFAAVLVLGSIGYLVALVYAVQGAVDLALTQFAIETLSLVVFMMVVRHLPPQFRARRLRSATVFSATVAVAVGAGVFSLAMLTTAAEPDRDVSAEIVERAYPDGGGDNVVNVILVDIRGLDTAGEISVLTVSAVGALALARVGRRGGRRTDPPAEPRPDLEEVTE